MVAFAMLIMWLIYSNSLKSHSQDCDSWLLIGPGGGGKITSITCDPQNKDYVYMTINVGGARRSRDGGKTWEIINRGFNYAAYGNEAQRLMDIAVHPKNSRAVLACSLSGIIYEWKEDEQAWQTVMEHPTVRTDRKGCEFSRFSFDPSNPDVVYVSVGSIQKLILGVSARRTENYWPRIEAGPTIIRGEYNQSRGTWFWREVGSIGMANTGQSGHGGGKFLNIYSVAVNPDNNKELFCMTEKGLYKVGLNAGHVLEATRQITEGLPSLTDKGRRGGMHGGQIAFNPYDAREAYLTAVNLDGDEKAGGVFKSLDGGLSWQRINGGLPGAFNYFDIAFDLQDKTGQTVYIAETHIRVKNSWIKGNLWKTEDGGRSWMAQVAADCSNLKTGWLKVDRKDKFGADFIHAEAGNVFWSAGGGYLFKNEGSVNGRTTWINILTKDLGEGRWATKGSEAIAAAHSIGIDPENTNHIYLPFGDHCFFESKDGGRSVSILADNQDIRRAGNKFDSGTMVVDKENGKWIYMATQGPHQQLIDGGVMFSKDSGHKWRTIGWNLKDSNEDRGAKTDLIVEYNGEKRNLYVANTGSKTVPGGVYVLYDFNPSACNNNLIWKRVFSSKNEPMAGTYRIAALNGFNTLYVAVNQRDGLLYCVKNLKQSGACSETVVRANRRFRRINDLESTSGGSLFMSADEGLFTLGRDGSLTEIRIPAFEEMKQRGYDPLVRAVAAHPGNEKIVYLASEAAGLFKSVDGGKNWNQIDNGLPTGGFVTLQVAPDSDTVYAVSPGSGVWKKTFLQ